MGRESRRDSRRDSLPRFKAGSRPPPNSVCTYNLGHVRQDVYACRRCTPAFAAVVERDAAASRASNGSRKNGGKNATSGVRAAASGAPTSRTGLATASNGPGAISNNAEAPILPRENVGDVAGFCGGCKAVCHGDHLHMVIDLYSKRGFRCDCGNARMGNECKLAPEKDPEPRASESRNAAVYNHNFVGKYCRCERGYDIKLGDMLQCAVCEDWFHELCFRMPNGEPPAQCNLSSVAYELVCAACAMKIPVLEDYFAHIGLFQPERAPVPLPNPTAQQRPKDCTRPTAVEKGALKGRDMLWPQGFRVKFCRCTECMKIYEEHGVAYLVDRKDFVSLQGLEDEAILAGAPSKEEIVKEVVKLRERRRRTGNAGSDPEISPDELNDDDEEEGSDGEFILDDTAPGRRSRRQRFSRSTRSELPAAVREYIRQRVAEFLNSALTNPNHRPTANDVRHTLATIRAEIVQGQVNSGQS